MAGRRKPQPTCATDLRQLIAKAAGRGAAGEHRVGALALAVGKRLLQDILKQKRAEYGDRLLDRGATIELVLAAGFREKPRRMIQFAEVSP